jgi:hypothetical protein
MISYDTESTERQVLLQAQNWSEGFKRTKKQVKWHLIVIDYVIAVKSTLSIKINQIKNHK